MIQGFEQKLARLASAEYAVTLQGRLIGLEKESLRVNNAGRIAQTPHPGGLGSALTNPHITTDYSEALLELITPPLRGAGEVLQFLHKIHAFVYQNISDELLWATSMPCVVEGESSIPIAYYGTSNAGMMKHVYRRGLGHRYGRSMQVIAGTHFNFSFPDAFWEAYSGLLGITKPLQQFVNDQYFCLIRNILRVGWVVPYLFGASPAVCASFFQGKKPSRLSALQAGTFYEPFGTSLRLGDIGYQNKKEVDSGVRVCYDDLGDYLSCLRKAITTPYPGYEAIGVKVDGEYRQLNANILQIENEYYSSVRPKQICDIFEKPVTALGNRGIRYVELRSPDVNAFDPLGISETEIRFLEVLFLYCLLHESPPIADDERAGIDANLLNVAHAGRQPGLLLQRAGQSVALLQWGQEICDDMLAVSEVLDRLHGGDAYSRTVLLQLEKFHDPDATPSAVMLAQLRANKESFFEFALRTSLTYQETFRNFTLTAEDQAFFTALATQSLERQQRMEAEDSMDFDTYLQRYFAG